MSIPSVKEVSANYTYDPWQIAPNVKASTLKVNAHCIRS